MNFLITGFVSEDVSASLDIVANPFADELRTRLTNIDSSCPLALLVYGPIILSPALGSVDSDVKVSRRTRSIILSENTGHEAWMAATRQERLHMYASALKAALAKVDVESLPTRFRTEITEAIDAAVHAIASNTESADV